MIREASCPVCHRPASAEGAASKFAPFCSERCRQVDFFRWFEGRYAIVEQLDPELMDPELLEGERDFPERS